VCVCVCVCVGEGWTPLKITGFLWEWFASRILYWRNGDVQAEHQSLYHGALSPRYSASSLSLRWRTCGTHREDPGGKYCMEGQCYGRAHHLTLTRNSCLKELAVNWELILFKLTCHSSEVDGTLRPTTNSSNLNWRVTWTVNPTVTGDLMTSCFALLGPLRLTPCEISWINQTSLNSIRWMTDEMTGEVIIMIGKEIFVKRDPLT